MAHQEWSQDEFEEAQRLALQGEPLAQIAARVGRTYHAVALKLSRTGVASRHATWRWKPKCVQPVSRLRVRAFAKLLNQEGWSVRRLARREGLAVTSLVDALQAHEPVAWRRYVEDHSRLRPRACPGCGNHFVPLTGKQRFCAVRCRESYRRNLAYFGGRRLEAVGLRDGICQLCGKNSAKWLSAHHVLGKENDPDNAALIALCRGCHDLVTILSARPWVERPDVVADLIALSLARRGRVGAFVLVDIANRSEGEIQDCARPFDGPLEMGGSRRPKRKPSRSSRKRESSEPGHAFMAPGDTLKWLQHVRAERVHLGRDGSR